MTYKARPGVVMTKICNVWLLVPTRKASEECPHVMRLNMLTSIIWETYEKNMPMEKAVSAFRTLTKKTDEEVHAKMQEIIDKLCEYGFLIAEEQEE